MIENITKNGSNFATIIRSDYKSTGIEFFTPSNSPQQLGYMNRSKGYIIDPHKHSHVEKTINRSFETLIVRSGKVKVLIYDENDNFFAETIISKGDIIMIGDCGHGYEMLEDSEMIEIKQGPYMGDNHTIAIEAAYSTVSSHRR